MGRLVQRLQELGNYRNLSLLGLPMVQENLPRLAAIEARLASLSAKLSSPAVSDMDLLLELSRLASDATAIEAQTEFRTSATRAYAEIALARLHALDCTKVTGCLSLADFTERRLVPAVRTCRSFEERLTTLSGRIERTTALLRTRVNMILEVQNNQVLKEMELSASRHLKLQQILESLSVVAASYYIYSLIGHFIPSLTEIFNLSEVKVNTILIPLILGAVIAIMHRQKRVLEAKSIHRDSEPVIRLTKPDALLHRSDQGSIPVSSSSD